MSRSAVPEPSWWREDPERWELLEFDGRYDGDGLPVDACWEDRQQVLHALVREPAPGDGDFARFLLVQETRWHRHSWGFNHSIELAALRVAEERRVEDVWILWEAVCGSFDTWCGLPHHLLLAAGVAATTQYVEDSGHPRRDNLLDHLGKMSRTTDEEVARTLARRRRHYREIIGGTSGK
ncbi:hypothetical protein ACFOOM_03740 [Streptomyces echinoruber]|uniref:Uncharacterized protein n=1 Tax=Streptomyces echinoruber TaxID=68898 RepID=A0A918QWZ3_9ACTN|nr:hypothetical protein [Streptomyces echinoruber]GGZ70720.1 hypothetical protein GCM10010389_05280 [Streptomyces echinoruber]